MEEDTARSILSAALQEYRARPYQTLAGIVGQMNVREVRAPDGTRYQLELQVLWDGKTGGAVRVLGAIDDGGATCLPAAHVGFHSESRRELRRRMMR